MSLPAKYQKNIIDKIINDFPELIFDKNNDVLDDDVHFETYVKIIKQGSKIEEEIKKFNETFKIPHDKLLSFNTGKMIIDIDGLISESYKKILKLQEHRDKLQKDIEYLENYNKKLLTDITQKNQNIENLSNKINDCKLKKDTALKTIEDDKKIKQNLEQKCSLIEKNYQREVKKNKELTNKSNKKIAVNKKKLLNIRKKLSDINQKLDDYNKKVGYQSSNNNSNSNSNNNNTNSNISDEGNNNLKVEKPKKKKKKKKKKKEKKEKKEKKITKDNFGFFNDF
jgi:chromosome segregation ATPase